MSLKPEKPVDWTKRFNNPKPPRTVTLDKYFAGIKAGSRMYISSPKDIANYISKIPYGETRSIERMRDELAKNNSAVATCPVTTAIFLRIVSELSLEEMNSGKSKNDVVPFWRVIEPGSKIAGRLPCDDITIKDFRSMESAYAVTKAVNSADSTS